MERTACSSSYINLSAAEHPEKEVHERSAARPRGPISLCARAQKSNFSANQKSALCEHMRAALFARKPNADYF